MDISQTDGLRVITDMLDKIYLCDEHTMTYMVFKDFYFYKRTAEVNIYKFLIRYDFLCQKLHRFGITLLEVQAFLFWMLQMHQ